MRNLLRLGRSFSLAMLTVVSSFSFSCTTVRDSIFVKSYGEIPDFSKPIQFYLEQKTNESFEQFSYRRKITDFCESELQNKNFTVNDYNKDCHDCFTILVSIDVDKVTEIVRHPAISTASTNCFAGLFNNVSCTTWKSESASDTTKNFFFRKVAGISIFEFDREKSQPKEYRNIFSVYTSRHDSVNDMIASYLCRGMIVGLQKDVADEFPLANTSIKRRNGK